MVFAPCVCLAAPSIFELVAVGNSSHFDEDGDTPDWLEVHNPDGAAIDLSGYYLTDDPGALTKWAFPSTNLPAGGHLVVFASDKDRALSGSELHANFKLSSSGEYLALVDPDGSTVVSEFSPGFPQQVVGYSYGIGSGAGTGYFEVPTPGAANGAALPGLLLTPTISPSGGTFTGSVQVTLGTAFPGGKIRYTTDGSLPLATSPLFVNPQSFSATTHLRAAVFDPVSDERGVVVGRQFVELAGSSDFAGIDAPAAFTSDLPIIVFENFGAGAIPSSGSSSFQAGRILVCEVDPATGLSSLAAAPDADLRVGIRERGRTSGGVNFDKKQYRVELRDEHDQDRDHKLLGLPSESDWVFNGPWVDKSLIRNATAFALGKDIGIQAPRYKHFEMFLNTGGGDLASSEYIGVYVLLEKIKDGKNRTDLANLGAADNAEPEISGGYLMSFENGSFGIEEPDPVTGAQQTWIRNYVESFASNALGWTGGGPNDTGAIDNDPVTGYPAYIDIDSFIHLMVINELSCEQDAYVRSDYMFKDRGGKLHKGPLWDYNLSSGTGTSRNTNEVWFYARNYNRNGQSSSYLSDMFVPLMRDANFRQAFIDRLSGLRAQGVLQETELDALINSIADPLSASALRNFTRWPVLNTSLWLSEINTTTWEEQIVALKDWLHARLDWMEGEMPQLVTFSLAAGELTPGTPVTLSGGSGTTIYYTLDGSDPRAVGCGFNPAAVNLGFGGTVTVNSSIDIIARSFDDTDWSAPSQVTFVVGTAADATNLAITEINYHPSDPTAAEVAADPTYRDDDFEFIELRNISASPIDLSGMAFVDGVEFVVPAGIVLAPGAFALLVENAAAFEARYGTGFDLIGDYSNKMSNDGETLRLVDVSGADIAHFTFNDIWYPTTDGGGDTLTLADELAIPADYGIPSAWAVSSNLLGTPGSSVNAFALWGVSVTSSAYNAANVACTVNMDADAVTVYWGTGDPGETTVGWTGTPIPLGFRPAGSVPVVLAGLDENTTYFFRYFGSITSPAEDDWSSPGAFTTPLQFAIPVLGTPTVTATFDDGADVECQLLDADATSTWIVWDSTDQGTPASAPGSWDNSANFGSALENATLAHAIRGTTTNTSYVCRFFASNASGFGWSELGTFDTTTPAPDPNLVAHYVLDGSAADTSGNDYHGIVNGATFVVDGVRGTVASFDGSSSINLTSGFPYSLGDLPNGGFSTSFWILPSVDNGSNSSPDSLIIMGGSSPGKGVIEIVGDTAWGGMGGTSARGGVGVNSGGGGGKTGKVAGIDLYDGDWHHVVIQWAGDPNTDIETWIDNTVATTYGNGYNGSSESPTALRLGGPAVWSNGGAADKYYTGLMSDVRFFAGQLNAIQVDALFTGVSVIETNGDAVAEALTGPGGPFEGQSDPDVVGFTANPDGDEWPNAFEVLLGFDPAAAAGNGSPLTTQFVNDAGQIWLEAVVEVDGAMDDLLTWHVEWSSDLIAWDESTNTQVVVGEAGGVRTVSIRDEQAVETGGRRFVRMKILPGE